MLNTIVLFQLPHKRINLNGLAHCDNIQSDFGLNESSKDQIKKEQKQRIIFQHLIVGSLQIQIDSWINYSFFGKKMHWTKKMNCCAYQIQHIPIADDDWLRFIAVIWILKFYITNSMTQIKKLTHENLSIGKGIQNLFYTLDVCVCLCVCVLCAYSKWFL